MNTSNREIAETDERVIDYYMISIDNMGVKEIYSRFGYWTDDQINDD